MVSKEKIYFTITGVNKCFSDWGESCSGEDEIFDEYITKARWPNGIRCCFCNSVNVYLTNRGFRCGDCSKKFSIFTKTHFSGVKLGTVTLLAAVFHFLNDNKITAAQLQRELEITYKTSFYLLRKIKLNEEKR